MNIISKPRVRPLPVMQHGRGVKPHRVGILWSCASGMRAAYGRSPAEAQERFFKGDSHCMSKGADHA